MLVLYTVDPTTRISVQLTKSSSKQGGRCYKGLELFSTFCGYTKQIDKVTWFDTSFIKIGPAVGCGRRCARISVDILYDWLSRSCNHLTELLRTVHVTQRC